jgi:hypothetical protein
MKYRILVFASLCALALLVCPAIRAEDEESIKQAMSSEEFHKAGLDKLTDEELRNLDRWLKGDREKTAKKAAARSSQTKMDLVVSRVSGHFSGLTGRTLIELEDGTVWRQANSLDHFGGSPVENPGAAVVRSVFGYKMRIEGVPEFYVNPVRK